MPISTYWTIENAAPGVQDRLDGRTEGTHRPIHDPGQLSPEGQRILEGLGIRGRHLLNVTIEGGVALRSVPPLYIFCMSTTADPTIFNNTVEVTTIPSVPRLAEAVVRSSEGRFTRWYAGHVQYRPVEYNLADGVPRPNPFVKGPDFAYQAEVRMAFVPRPGLDGPQFVQSVLLIHALS